jgi:hypothetical protein
MKSVLNKLASLLSAQASVIFGCAYSFYVKPDCLDPKGLNWTTVTNPEFPHLPQVRSELRTFTVCLQFKQYLASAAAFA